MRGQGQEIRKYEKFGFCNKRDSCPRYHPTVLCEKDSISDLHQSFSNLCNVTNPEILKISTIGHETSFHEEVEDNALAVK